MTTQTNRAHPAPGASLYGLYVLSVTSALGGNLFVRISEEAGWLGPKARITIAALAVLPLIVAAAWFWRLLRSDLDEMLQRIVLEGLAFGLIIYLPLAALFVNLRTAGAWVPRLDPADSLMLPALLVGLGIIVAWRRVQ